MATEAAGPKVVQAVWAALFGPADAERLIAIVRSIPEQYFTNGKDPQWVISKRAISMQLDS
ncbi:hypothetical protein N7448_003559 [Penicillium atrosanguineum]|uniref:Uncharacterized protein n=1 Tax=Penicillium atrosanguineum TaxID=1132637 RepID=A0A9W9PWB9_9EURO|nr:uncharacterized protein N7443_002527 [Penicillium atrosanguineum]KAJ5122423.1 hypothetical protein N7526_009360 [Penicillium atrosanguineum]KAJ5140151.1 hypothetical protein N7448_003559 [Penicillium atrosanguineum]KAJ5310066.1 hypothetical protein N7443_002527 [Penicillium atrosanguineum]KAJ5315584.1 hypothetical protein N7476_005891 [Penicillium atrosanguineum]